MIDLFCYAILNNQVLDLSSLCQPVPVEVLAPLPDTDTEAFPTLIEDFRFNADGFFVGRIRNVSSRALRSVRIHYEAYDASENYLDGGSFYVDPPTILPGDVSTFKWFAPKGTETVRIVKTTWQE